MTHSVQNSLQVSTTARCHTTGSLDQVPAQLQQQSLHVQRHKGTASGNTPYFPASGHWLVWYDNGGKCWDLPYMANNTRPFCPALLTQPVVQQAETPGNSSQLTMHYTMYINRCMQSHGHAISPPTKPTYATRKHQLQPAD